jgi:hypothetical protein
MTAAPERPLPAVLEPQGRARGSTSCPTHDRTRGRAASRLAMASNRARAWDRARSGEIADPGDRRSGAGRR